ncbi:hypothetical protein [Pontibacter liquoris]|uniref:hypothetical protein n=1 Tax=Pontibacter liquoris TaxID=2905677 RepID=UPI001FA7E008|nr:hypothetical protein [Pontibacter liquoris]
MKPREKDRISPEKAKEMLRREGVEVSLSEAKAVLEFLRLFAKIAVNQYLRNGNS